MTDRELLELAAKATGEKLIPFETLPMLDREDTPYWNPLMEDGDALRLAVKLHLAISWTTCFVQVGYVQEKYMEGEDAAPTIRRAIVRAAAEIGKTK